MVQTLIVIGLFLVAGFLLGRRLYNQFSGKKQPGCEKCAANEIASK
ncbi:hypothetical protein [Marinoscillum sp.]